MLQFETINQLLVNYDSNESDRTYEQLSAILLSLPLNSLIASNFKPQSVSRFLR